MTATVREFNDARRRLNCRPLQRDVNVDELFFCHLGTLWCTEAHGVWEETGAQAEADGKKLVFDGIVGSWQ